MLIVCVEEGWRGGGGLIREGGLIEDLWYSLTGTLGGTQYCNTVRKIGKYRDNVSKIDEIPVPHL